MDEFDKFEGDKGTI